MKIILTALAGSHAHGIATETSDYDYLSVAMAPMEALLGLEPYKETIQSRTAPQGGRAAPGDVEHTMYELRHFVKLAAQGNPNILVPLFAADEHVEIFDPTGMSLRMDLPLLVLSRQTLVRHLGYLDAQRGRMVGEGPHQSRKPNRPELVEAHGYDTKYAAHALRLGLQGLQVAAEGRLTLPMNPTDAAFLRSIRSGEVSEFEALNRIDQVRDFLRQYVDGEARCNLPVEPDWQRINGWLVWAYQSTYLGY